VGFGRRILKFDFLPDLSAIGGHVTALSTKQPYPLRAILAISFVMAFRDLKVLGLGMQAWQVLLGLGLLFQPSTAAISRDRIPEEKALLWLVLYSGSWFLLSNAIHWEGFSEIHPGFFFDLIFAYGLFKWLRGQNASERERSLRFIMVSFLAFNFLAALLEVSLGPTSIDLVHQTAYSAEGRIRMLFGEPSYIYAPLFTAIAIIYRLRFKFRNLFLIIGIVTLLLSGSKSLFLVLPLAYMIALLLDGNYPFSRKMGQMVGGTLAFAGLIWLFSILSPVTYKSLFVDAVNPLFESRLNLTDFVSTQDPGQSGSFATRGILWVHSLAVIGGNPVLGVGPGRESEALIQESLSTGLTTPEINRYIAENPNLVTSKTFAWSYIMSYGLMGVLPLLFMFRRFFAWTCPLYLKFTFLFLLIASLQSQGFPFFAWWACLYFCLPIIKLHPSKKAVCCIT
jgi:hypothetical protein